MSAAILKTVAPNWPGDSLGHDRERLFYSLMAPKLDRKQPQGCYAGIDPESGSRLILLEDMHSSHRFPQPTHTWTQAGSLYWFEKSTFVDDRDVMRTNLRSIQALLKEAECLRLRIGTDAEGIRKAVDDL